MTKASGGTWLARAYDGARYAYEPLGDFATFPEKERFDEACKAAEAWFQHLDLGGSSEPHTIKETCEAYIGKVRLEKSEQTASETEGYFRRLVYGDPIAKVLLSKLTKKHMAAWRDRALQHNDDRSSFNRNITPLRAALNLAHEQGKVGTDQAWLAALRPFSEKDLQTQRPRRRKGILDREERQQLVEAASEEAKPFFRALTLLPMRPGEVAALRVEYLNNHDMSLEIPAGKGEARIIPLPGAAFAHLKACARGKLPYAWLISRANGSQWKKEAWRDEIKSASKKAGLPRATVAYTLRHSLITELVKGDVGRGIPPLDIFTTAKLAGTSVKMIEKHYGHLQREHARSALEKLALA
jgi:site-specific recombinase XerD